MTKSEVWAELEKRGVDEAIVEFSGGNDEGGCDTITLYKDGKNIQELSEWPTPSDNDADLIEALTAPVYSEYSSFAGDFYVNGRVIWNCKDQIVIMDGAEQGEWVSFNKEV